jgi:hypothetical protein
LNPGRRGGKPATNLLSYGAAKGCFNCFFYIEVVEERNLSIPLNTGGGREFKKENMEVKLQVPLKTGNFLPC